MKQLIETFVTVFLVTIFVLLLSQFIGAELQINNAKDFHAECISQIEASDFDATVIQKCKDIATEHDMSLKVQNRTTEQMICNSCNTVFELGDTKCPNCGNTHSVEFTEDRICKVQLQYDVNLKLLNVQKRGSINGYAR